MRNYTDREACDPTYFGIVFASWSILCVRGRDVLAFVNLTFLAEAIDLLIVINTHRRLLHIQQNGHVSGQ